MSGSWWTYNETNWPTGTTLATYSYTSADIGAWNLLLANTGATIGGVWKPAYYASCLYSAGTQYYTPCLISAYGSNQMPNYTCQGNCASGPKRGGQCKPFMNLVAYRSGLYQNPGFAWKAFPVDKCITYTTASCNTGSPVLRPTNDTDMPMATYANIVEGDYLRRPNGHATIVVRKISSTNVIVLDSNWTGGDGAEEVSSHSMAFGTGDTNSNLGAYRVLKCAYTGAC